ncbi:MAG: hypothetical protein ACT4QD_08315 [Acidobacteriota bacterium]
MTRARAFKTAIRARAAKTGERYTTARRHVLNARKAKATQPASGHAAAAPAAAIPRSSSGTETPRRPAAQAHQTSRPSRAENPATRVSASAPVTAKGSVSDAKSREKTGHGLDRWFDVLDRFGAPEKGHAAAARHLYEDHGVDGWYAQGITVAYERARGIRVLNQRCDGEYEVSASKVVAASSKAIVGALTNPRTRARWADGAEPVLITALARALDASPSAAGARKSGKASKASTPAASSGKTASTSRPSGFIVKPDGQARFRYKWDETTVELRITPKPGGKASLVVQHMKLAAPDVVEQRRAQWREAFAALAAHFGG